MQVLLRNDWSDKCANTPPPTTIHTRLCDNVPVTSVKIVINYQTYIVMKFIFA